MQTFFEKTSVVEAKKELSNLTVDLLKDEGGISDQVSNQWYNIKSGSIFENHLAVMLLIDANSGGIVRANKAAQMFYGYSVEQFEKLTIYDINQLTNKEIDLEMKKAFVEERNYFHLCQCFLKKLNYLTL